AGSRSLKQQIHVLAELLAGLHHAHELQDYDGTALKVTHGAVSPRHVFITVDGHVRVVDFATLTNNEVVSPDVLAYLAPEQVRGEAVDRRADIFAVGVMLWEAIAGKPFGRPAPPDEKRRQRAEGTEPRIRALLPDAPSVLADSCDRALALAPGDRFQSALALREALLGYVDGDLSDSERGQLGELVMRSFRQERVRIHELIERSLDDADSHPGAHETQVSRVGPARVRVAAPDQPPVNLQPDETEQPADAGTQPAGRRYDLRVASAVGAGIVTLLLTAVWLYVSPRHSPTQLPHLVTTRQQPSPNPPPPSDAPRLDAPSPAPSPLHEPDEATLQLRVSAKPAGASLWLDDEPLTGNPVVERRVIDNRLHVLRAAGPGLRSQERIVAFDGDHAVSFKLAHLARAPERRVRAEAQPGVTPTADPPTNVTSPTVTTPPKAAPDEWSFDAPLPRKRSARAIDLEDPYR
ncbi:MAG: hypothetical protein ABW321_28725, partial [Polyangiales bacterium]